MPGLTINGRAIGDLEPCYVIAEIGSTHQGSVERAAQLIDVAAMCGVDAVKLQRKHVDQLYSRAMLDTPYDGLGPTYGTHKAAQEFSLHDLAALQGVAHEAGVTLFATAFDESSVADCEALQMPAFKVHSGGLTDRPLLVRLAQTGAPILLSTGGGTTADIMEAVRCLTDHGVTRERMAILHCTAIYPVTTASYLNLRCISRLQRQYPHTVIGWSAHDVYRDRAGIDHKILAYGLGARILEVHFTLDHELRGTDHSFALEPRGLRNLVRTLRLMHAAMGTGTKTYYEQERPFIAKMRRRPTEDGWRITGEADV